MLIVYKPETNPFVLMSLSKETVLKVTRHFSERLNSKNKIKTKEENAVEKIDLMYNIAKLKLTNGATVA